MGNKYASDKNAIALCDRCGFRFKLKELREITVKTKRVNLLVCMDCWEPDHPQLQVGMFPVDDPQALRNPRPDSSYFQSGYTGLQIDVNGGTGLLGNGYPAEGSRVIEWGWRPIGGASHDADGLTPNSLVSTGDVGMVQVITT
jgi:hypothetical protein